MKDFKGMSVGQSDNEITDDSEEDVEVANTSSSTDDSEVEPDTDIEIDSEGGGEVARLMEEWNSAKETLNVHPPEIKCQYDIVDLSFHPEKDIIAAALITGDVAVYKYTNEEVKLVENLELHTKACRDIEYSDDGLILYSCAKDKCIMLTDTTTGKLKTFYENSHEEPLFSLYVLDEHLFSTGDEGGTVKLWDNRQKKSILSFKEMEDFVSDMKTNTEQKYLVCTSGDGTLTTLDLVNKQLHVQSEPHEAELLCMGLFRRDTRVLVGSSKGKLYIYNWGEFGLHTDMFSNTKESVTSMIPVTENMAVVGDNDGIIRAINIYPNRTIGVVGQHNSPISGLDISHDGELIASCSDDETIKFWNIKYFEDLHVDDKTAADKRKSLNFNLPSSESANAGDFFSGLM